MDMYRVYKSIHDRMYKFLMAETPLAQDAHAGDTVLHLSDATYFGFEGLNEKYPEVILMDGNTTGERIPGGYAGAESVNVLTVSVENNTMQISSPLERDWLVSDASLVQRAPANTVVNRVAIGDLQVITKFPAVCVVPSNETIDWFTMPGGTKETINIDFMIYVTDGDTEAATEDLLKLASTVKWILMSNLHIQAKGESSVYGVTSKAIVGNIDYGVIQKGSEFLKAAKLSWTGEIYVLRDYMHYTENALYEGKYDSDQGVS